MQGRPRGVRKIAADAACQGRCRACATALVWRRRLKRARCRSAGRTKLQEWEVRNGKCGMSARSTWSLHCYNSSIISGFSFQVAGERKVHACRGGKNSAVPLCMAPTESTQERRDEGRGEGRAQGGGRGRGGRGEGREVAPGDLAPPGLRENLEQGVELCRTRPPLAHVHGPAEPPAVALCSCSPAGLTSLEAAFGH